MIKVFGKGTNLDCFALQETHSRLERTLAIEHELKHHAVLWSHCSLQRGGLALGGAHDFLTRFSSIGWQQLEQGRIEKLELRGHQGALDLYCIYLDDQSSAACRHPSNLLHSSCMPPSEVLSVMFGDFNAVERSQDRLFETSKPPASSQGPEIA